MKKNLLLPLLLLSLLGGVATAANDSVVKEPSNCKLQWADSKKDAHFFGVNYITGFSTPYNQITKMGIDIKDVIDSDTYHLARIGINAFRIHVWDSEISDVKGNLLANHHLELLDYLIYKLEERGIYVMLTPIYYSGSGDYMKYPYQGFSVNYKKIDTHSIPESIEAHRNYLTQFVSHVNPFNGKAYKDDPNIVAFEVCNEPWEKSAESAAKFASNMKKAIGETGCTKPIFYNATTTRAVATDILKTDIDGGTYQWYPAGLRISRSLSYNYLPHVDNYFIPYASQDFFKSKSKAIYEFDAADVAGGYLYPAMALSFKEAGMHWATMFQYEPTPLAASNTSYYTHYMHLAYAPSKGVALMIASELFCNEKFARNRTKESRPFEMEGYSVDYTKDLSTLSTAEKFYYTASTSLKPKELSELKHIAGCGSSSVVNYNGSGVYMLDKLSDSLWRLEVMPDAIAIKDPHSNPQLHDDKTLIRWNINKMSVHIPTLGDDFMVTAVNKDNEFNTKAVKGGFSIAPGAYLLSVRELDGSVKDMKLGNIKVSEYTAPKRADFDKECYLVHNPKSLAVEGVDLTIEATVVSDREIAYIGVQNPTLYDGVTSVRTPLNLKMERVSRYKYSATVEGDKLKSGIFNYTLLVHFADGELLAMPGGECDRLSSSLSYFKADNYSVNVVASGEPVQLFYPADLSNVITFAGKNGYFYSVKGSGRVGGAKLVFNATSYDKPTAEPNSGVNYVIEQGVAAKIGSLASVKDSYSKFTVEGKSLNSATTTLQLVAVNQNGEPYMASVKLNKRGGAVSANFASFKPYKLFLLPRPFPKYGNCWHEIAYKYGKMDISTIERLQIIVPEQGNVTKPTFELYSVTIE